MRARPLPSRNPIRIMTLPLRFATALLACSSFAYAGGGPPITPEDIDPGTYGDTFTSRIIRE